MSVTKHSGIFTRLTVQMKTYETLACFPKMLNLKDRYERKFNELQSEIDQLKDLLIAMIWKSNNSSADAQFQGSQKQPVRRSDTGQRNPQ